jgi:hypothetical protein
MTPDNFTSSREKRTSSTAVARPSQAYDRMGALRLRYHFIYSLHLLGSMHSRSTLLVLLGALPVMFCFLCGLRGRLVGVCKPFKGKGSFSEIEWMAFPLVLDPCTCFPSTTTEQQPWPDNRLPQRKGSAPEDDILLSLVFPRQLKLQGGRPKISGRSQERCHQIQIPKHASEAFPPGWTPGGTMTHIDGLSTSACTG